MRGRKEEGGSRELQLQKNEVEEQVLVAEDLLLTLLPILGRSYI